MLTYFIMLVISIGFAVMASYCSNEYTLKLTNEGRLISFKIKNMLVFLSAVPLALVSGLRYRVGVDYNSYSWIYDAITQLNTKTHVEKGYELLNHIVGFFTRDAVYIFLVTSIIIVTFFVLAIKHESVNFSYSMFLFITLGYYFYSMNSIRHFLALSIYFFAQRYMKKEEFVKYLALILLAATFHKIALIGIPIYFIFTRKFKFSYYAIIAVFLAICVVLNKQIMNLIYSFVYSAYKNSAYAVYDFSIYNVLLSGIATFFSIAYYKPLLEKKKSNIIYINAAILMLLFYLTCWWIPTPTRIGHFGTIYFILLFPEAISCEKNKKVRIFYYTALSMFAVVFLIIMLIQSQSPSIALIPYQSLFSR